MSTPGREAWSPDELVSRAWAAFGSDAQDPPPLTLRGGCDLDSYLPPSSFDPDQDEPTDEYLERYAFWGLGYLDAASWRHYLPRLLEYASTHPDDPAMVVEALIGSLCPPDRYPPRLASLGANQEDVVRAFLESLAFGEFGGVLHGDAEQALDEWWGPGARARPTAADIERQRRTPTEYREVLADGYRLVLPDTLVSSGMREIPCESRRVQTWGGVVCGDVHVIVAVNRLLNETRAPDELARWYARHFSIAAEPARCDVSGAGEAVRIEGETTIQGPGDPQRILLIVARVTDVFVLTVRTHERPDVSSVVDRIATSFVCR
jgi:hypothetical protein